MTAGSEGAASELLSALGRDVGLLLRDELRQIRDEANETLRGARKATMLLGGAGLLGALSAGVSAAALVRVLDRVMPRALSAWTVAGLLGAGSLTLTNAGLREVRRARAAMATERPLGTATGAAPGVSGRP